MTNNTPLPPPTIPTPPATNKPLWKKKRFFIPTAVVASLIAIGAVVPAEKDAAGASTAPSTIEASPNSEKVPGVTEVAETAPTTTEPAPTTTTASVPATTTAPRATTTTAPASASPSALGTAVTITHVVDGDTVDISTGERVRILGYDTPERGECGYDDATNALSFVLLGGNVTMTTDSGDNIDKYGRILRHILVNGTPVGLTMIETGNANARYDSLDGYPRHRYQNQYRAADGPNNFVCNAPAPVAPAPSRPATAPPATPAPVVPAPAPAPVVPAAPAAPSNNGPFANCDAVRAAGRAPILAGQPGFEQKFDRDGDGVGCE